MDIQTLKLDLVEKIINTEKTSLLLEISDFIFKQCKIRLVGQFTSGGSGFHPGRIEGCRRG